MTIAHHRKKAPDRVRCSLIDNAIRLAVEEGLASLSVQAVADAAGVTKGGFFHHFGNKRAFIDAMCEEMLDVIDREIDQLIAADAEPHGSFTRAYVESVFRLEQGTNGGPWASLSILVLADPILRARWSDWYERRLYRHRATDDDVTLEAVRLAADGIWLADLTGMQLLNRSRLREHLIQTTYNEKERARK